MAVAPQNIMSTLRTMPDAQLAQYAAMHKNDPFIFPLAFQESQSRKQTRAAQQAQMGGQEQPKVVDQMVSQMMPQQASQLPEDIGIGQLPAKNLQRMAGGGIVAFEEGGEVQRFQNQGLVENTPRISGESFQDYRRRIFDLELQTQRDRNNAEVTTRETERQRLLAQQPDGLIPPSPFFDRKPLPASPAMQAATTAAFAIPESTIKGTGDTKAVDQMAVDMAASQKNKSKTNANADLTMTDKGKASTGSGKTDSKPVGGLDALSAAYKPSSAADLGKTAKELASEANKDSEAAYKPYAEMLQKERADLEGRKSENKSMALLRAGLGIMGGKSRYASQNISQGGVEGLNAYQEAKRLDDASKKALMGSEIAMMQAQRAERSGNHKDAVALIGQAEQNQQFGVNAGLKAQELKQTGEYQKGMIGVQQGRNEILGANNAQANKQMAEYGKIQAAVTKSLATDMVYAGLKTDAERQAYQTKLLQQQIANNPFLAALGSGIGFVPKPSGKVVGDFSEV